MLKPKPKAPAAAPPEPSPKEAARALLSMLGEGGGGGGAAIPDAQMRLLARDLIAQVEGRTSPATAPEPEPVPQRRRKLFSRAAPLAPLPEADGPPPEAPPEPVAPPPEPPAMRVPEQPRIQSRPDRAPPASDLPTTLSLPARRVRRSAPPPILPFGQVQKLALQGVELGEIEHPAILALTLRGRPPLEQAVALRALPRGQARAVHRALRMMEGRG